MKIYLNDRVSVSHRPQTQKKGHWFQYIEEAGVKTMNCKGYRGQVNYNEGAKLFHGEVVGLRDSIFPRCLGDTVFPSNFKFEKTKCHL